jgi:hypothetical protein
VGWSPLARREAAHGDGAAHREGPPDLVGNRVSLPDGLKLRLPEALKDQRSSCDGCLALILLSPI